MITIQSIPHKIIRYPYYKTEIVRNKICKKILIKIWYTGFIFNCANIVRYYITNDIF